MLAVFHDDESSFEVFAKGFIKNYRPGASVLALNTSNLWEELFEKRFHPLPMKAIDKFPYWLQALFVTQNPLSGGLVLVRTPPLCVNALDDAK